MDLVPIRYRRSQRHSEVPERGIKTLFSSPGALVLGGAGLLASVAWLYRAVLPKFQKHSSSSPEQTQGAKLNRAALDVLQGHFCILDETGTIIFVNRAWREFAAANPPIRTEVCEGANYLEVCDAAVGEPTAGECGSALREMLAGRLSEYSLEYPCHSPTEERWFVARAYRYLDEGAVRIVIAHIPITERKLAERAVKESEERYRTIVEQAFDGILVCNPQGHLLLVNDMACQISGYSRKELLHMTALQLIAPEDHPRFEIMWKEVLAHRFDQSEWSLVHKDGTRVPVELRARRKANGNLLGFVCDLTHRKEAEALRAAHEAAERTSRAKDQFLAMLSHELRTPLAPVLLATHMIEQDSGLPEPVRELGATIHRNIDVQAHLIDDLLDETRIACGKLELQLQRTSVNEVIQHVMEILAGEFTAKQLQVETELRATHPHVEADVARLQQILWNLLKNAAKFTPFRGKITVRASNPHPQRVRIDISDTGIGIAPELLARLFQPFEQGGADTTRRFGGLGLGLAISDKLAKLHGGTLSAESPGEGLGATFTLELPVAASQSLQAPAQPGAPEKRITPRHLRILLVEDHTDTARILARILERRGHHVHISTSLHDAEAAAETEPLDLVLSDIELPDGSGYELMQFLRETHPVPGIAMSGHGMEQDVKRSREAGFSEHLVKPVDPERLEKAIEKVAARTS